jgi:hypothetical protein
MLERIVVISKIIVGIFVVSLLALPSNIRLACN